MFLRLEREFVQKTEGFSVSGEVSSLDVLKHVLAMPGLRHDIVILNPFPSLNTLEQTMNLIRSAKGRKEVIIVSSCAEFSFISSAYLLGIFDYILTPFAFSRFQSSLLDCKNFLRTLDAFPAKITQKKLDELLERRKPSVCRSFRTLPKSPDEKQLAIIMHILCKAGHPLKAAEIAQQTGLSRTTIWRYLRYLTKTEFITSKQKRTHPGPGRPTLLFSLLNGRRGSRTIIPAQNEQKQE